MPLEIEVKFLDVDHADLRLRLAHLGAHCVGRWFEANVVFDDARRSLKAAGALLRLREKSGRVVLTLKCASAGQVSDTVKICDESETDVADAASMRLILAGLGFSPALRYEKVREKWLALGCEVCLDTLPFGSFLEIEGSEEDIAACSRALGLHSDRASTATYHELNR
ncbi:MAG: class IV adenylate cyclase, partial [Humidesulfovibrio sp.]|nr:class IV adenylate cyclase [Humidesulfovibrio sp.]